MAGDYVRWLQGAGTVTGLSVVHISLSQSHMLLPSVFFHGWNEAYEKCMSCYIYYLTCRFFLCLTAYSLQGISQIISDILMFLDVIETFPSGHSVHMLRLNPA